MSEQKLLSCCGNNDPRSKLPGEVVELPSLKVLETDETLLYEENQQGWKPWCRCLCEPTFLPSEKEHFATNILFSSYPTSNVKPLGVRAK